MILIRQYHGYLVRGDHMVTRDNRLDFFEKKLDDGFIHHLQPGWSLAYRACGKSATEKGDI